MTRQLLIVVLFLLCLVSCRNGVDEGHARLRGALNGIQGEWIYLEELLIRDRVVVDSAKTGKDGSFSFYLDIATPGFYLLRTGDAFPLMMIIKPGEDIQIQSNASLSPEYSSFEGSAENEVLMNFLITRKRYESSIDSLTSLFRDASGLADFQEIKQSLDQTYIRLFGNYKEKVEKLIMENDTSILALLLLNQRLGRELLFPEESSLALFAHLDSVLSQRYPDNIHAGDHQERVAVLKRRLYDLRLAKEAIAPGMPAPHFVLNTPDGRSVSLETLRGRPLLIYLWSAESALCRLHNRQLPEILKSLKDLQLLAVSMDVHKQVWEGAIRLDDLPGMHVSDLLGTKSPMQQIYLPDREVPYYYLIDKEGNIVAGFKQPEEIKKYYKQLSQYIIRNQISILIPGSVA